ncbi:hypothetical protein BDV98DRAFT_577827 [Pterulicium gracile]|uniref:Uncharacterized protein n=1 Tax=Pterulicium gracile TaxID=1884261 RepID=A0A5C3QAC6_9AGAR|nr:hypothetical protein BDV98DRAFT_577827 [Pterula gracilis]
MSGRWLAARWQTVSLRVVLCCSGYVFLCRMSFPLNSRVLSFQYKCSPTLFQQDINQHITVFTCDSLW